MVSERHHSSALSYEQALEEMERGAGTQFDPGLVKIFLSIIKTTLAATIEQNMK